MPESIPVYVLDSFAVLAHFQGKPEGAQVLELLEKAARGAVSLSMSLINVGEMAYLASRERGRKKAKSMLDDFIRSTNHLLRSQ